MTRATMPRSGKERQEILDEMPKWKRTFFNIPVRHVNAQERMEQILLAQTEYDYRHGQAVALDSLKQVGLPLFNWPHGRIHWINSASWRLS